MSRAFAVDRELLLMAYEQVTPPRTPEQSAARQRLLSAARAILHPEPTKPRQLALHGVDR